MLSEKEAEAKRVESEMTEAIQKLQFEIEVLRESNNGLVSDLLRVEQEIQMTQERLETEKIELKSQLRCHYEQMIAGKEEEFAGERERLSASHAAATEELKQRNENESRNMQDEFRVAFRNLEEKLTEEKAQLTASYEEKLTLANQHQQAVVEELNRNYEEAADNVSIFSLYFCLVFFLINQCNFILRSKSSNKLWTASGWNFRPHWLPLKPKTNSIVPRWRR